MLFTLYPIKNSNHLQKTNFTPPPPLTLTILTLPSSHKKAIGLSSSHAQHHVSHCTISSLLHNHQLCLQQWRQLGTLPLQPPILHHHASHHISSFPRNHYLHPQQRLRLGRILCKHNAATKPLPTKRCHHKQQLPSGLRTTTTGEPPPLCTISHPTP